jgi:dCTP deaminase
MAFWGRERWLTEGKTGVENTPVTPWQEDRVEAAGYRLSVGKEYFVNGDGLSTVVKLDYEDTFVVSPGQFAFILTKEKVQISKSAIGFISIRASIKFKGLVNVSGFQVNPGFNGNLVFAVFNAGPRHINLREGEEIFSLWIADLDAEVKGNHEDNGKIPNNLSNIPMDTVNGISGDALTAYQLDSRIKKVEADHNKLKLLITRVILGLGGLTAWLAIVYRTELIELVNPSPPDTPTQQEQPIDNDAPETATSSEDSD